MKKTLTTIALMGLLSGCTTITQDMRGANKVNGDCLTKSTYLARALKEEGKSPEIICVYLKETDQLHAIVRYKGKDGWIYLDPGFRRISNSIIGEYRCKFREAEK